MRGRVTDLANGDAARIRALQKPRDGVLQPLGREVLQHSWALKVSAHLLQRGSALTQIGARDGEGSSVDGVAQHDEPRAVRLAIDTEPRRVQGCVLLPAHFDVSTLAAALHLPPSDNGSVVFGVGEALDPVDAVVVVLVPVVLHGADGCIRSGGTVRPGLWKFVHQVREGTVDVSDTGIAAHEILHTRMDEMDIHGPRNQK